MPAPRYRLETNLGVIETWSWGRPMRWWVTTPGGREFRGYPHTLGGGFPSHHAAWAFLQWYQRALTYFVARPDTYRPLAVISGLRCLAWPAGVMYYLVEQPAEIRRQGIILSQDTIRVERTAGPARLLNEAEYAAILAQYNSSVSPVSNSSRT